MKAKIDKEFEVVQNSELVWDFFSNPHKVVTCVPGAKITEQVDETNYKGTVKVKIGPVTTNFKGTVVLATMDKDNLEMKITGKGSDIKGKGNASMELIGKLEKRPDGGTHVATAMELNITGKLAQFGARMIVDVTNQIFKQFIGNLQNKLAQEAESQAPATPPPATETENVAIAKDGPTQMPDSPIVQAETKPASEPKPTPTTEHEEVKPISALPLFFKFIFGSIARFFKRLFGIKPKE